MIERQVIDGKGATLVYLDKEFSPVDKEQAELVKVIFDNGNVVFMGKDNGNSDSQSD